MTKNKLTKKDFQIYSDEGEISFGYGSFKFSRLSYVLPDTKGHYQLKAITKLPDAEKDLEEDLKEFLQSSQISFCAYGWSNHSVILFIKDLEKNGNHLREEYLGVTEHSFKDGTQPTLWNFHGNIEEYSGAFDFTIFDAATAKRVKAFIAREKAYYNAKRGILPTFKYRKKIYTVDYRLQQFRNIDKDGYMSYIDFRDSFGDRILAKMIRDGVADTNRLRL